ncbi:MAG: ATP-binding protein, partial [Gammaproteobacteria bacterium]|nr:ATP-binding protein [Gammaproteobacteria bacterium]
MDSPTFLNRYQIHNQFRDSAKQFNQQDPHLNALSKLKYSYHADWWSLISLNIPGIYILTGGRQVGKSTSCKQLISYCLKTKQFAPDQIFYLPCDEIYDAQEFGRILRLYFSSVSDKPFLLIIDEVTFVPHWDRTIKALADEGYFTKGLCVLTGSDSLILKEAAMSFPGRRGHAAKTDFHLYPLSFREYVQLIKSKGKLSDATLLTYFQNYLRCGGYLRAINDLAEYGEVTPATFITYEQWIRGDFLKQGKNEDTLLNVLKALLTVGVSQISYSGLTQKIGLISKETFMDYCRLLERMDVMIVLQAFDQNKKQGFPRKARKFHFFDPFIYHTIQKWLENEGYLNGVLSESTLVEACVASQCYRLGKTFYFKGQ